MTGQKGGASALGLQRVLGLGSYRTGWSLLHKLRRAMVRPGRDRLQGVVEVDEIFIGGPRPGKRGRGAQGKALVVIAAQQAAKGIGRIRLTRVAHASASSLEAAIAEGAVVTIDAMGCQRDIAQKIIDKKADTILALKGNQGTLRDDVEMFAREQKAVAFKNASVSRDTTVDGDHGRIETRTVTVFHDIGWLQDNHQWPGLKSVVMVESERETDGKVETETRFYITSLALLANALGPMIRSHWMVENGLHWVLDMIFRDDECRVRTDNAPFNLAIVKHIALNVLRTRKSKDSLRMRRKVAAWDENALAAYIAA